MNYLINFKGKTFSPSGKLKKDLLDSEIEKINKEASKREKAFYLEQKPLKIFGYVKGEIGETRYITTWKGDIFGRIIYSFQAYISNFGDKRERIGVKLENGIEYYGIIFSDYGYCRLTKKKGKGA